MYVYLYFTGVQDCDFDGFNTLSETQVPHDVNPWMKPE